jgi:hypothetical protein
MPCTQARHSQKPHLGVQILPQPHKLHCTIGKVTARPTTIPSDSILLHCLVGSTGVTLVSVHTSVSCRQAACQTVSTFALLWRRCHSPAECSSAGRK